MEENTRNNVKNVEEKDEICGCRVVEKVKGKAKPYYRLEIWLRSKNEDMTEKIKQKLMDLLTHGDAASQKLRLSSDFFELKLR